MADIKARRLAFIACGWFASSWLAIKDEAKIPSGKEMPIL